jgi:multiubiquitin
MTQDEDGTATAQQGSGGAPSPSDKITVIVNGRPREVVQLLLSFDDIVRLAFDPVPTGPNVLLTVSFRNAADEKKGTLVEGESIEVKEHGTVFNVTATDKS